MSSISNRFVVTSLDDGTTLHGSLSSTGRPLTQAWNGASAVPNWEGAANTGNQPTIKLTLLSGSTAVMPDSDFNWYYNEGQNANNPIAFSGTLSTIHDNETNTDVQGWYDTNNGGKFFKVKVADNTPPQLRLVGNIARSGNVDDDIITFKGNYTPSSGGNIPFQASVQLRVAAIDANGYTGVVTFVGESDITQKGQTVYMYARLYKGTSEMGSASFRTTYFVNDSVSGTQGAPIVVNNTTYQQGFSVNETQITDYSVIRCEFRDTDGNLVYTAYVDVDDVQDDDFMYIQYAAGANGNKASLKSGESVTFNVWVGTRDDATPQSGWTYKVRVLDAYGDVISGTLAGFNDCISGDPNYYRNMTTANNKASCTVAYSTVVEHGKEITGILLANHS